MSIVISRNITFLWWTFIHDLDFDDVILVNPFNGFIRNFILSYVVFAVPNKPKLMELPPALNLINGRYTRPTGELDEYRVHFTGDGYSRFFGPYLASSTTHRFYINVPTPGAEYIMTVITVSGEKENTATISLWSCKCISLILKVLGKSVGG